MWCDKIFNIKCTSESRNTRKYPNTEFPAFLTWISKNDLFCELLEEAHSKNSVSRFYDRSHLFLSWSIAYTYSWRLHSLTSALSALCKQKEHVDSSQSTKHTFLLVIRFVTGALYLVLIYTIHKENYNYEKRWGPSRLKCLSIELAKNNATAQRRMKKSDPKTIGRHLVRAFSFNITLCEIKQTFRRILFIKHKKRGYKKIDSHSYAYSAQDNTHDLVVVGK